jgi:thiol-disulfide isomerase/thioredoxin
MRRLLLLFLLSMAASAPLPAADLPTGVIALKPYEAPPLRLADMDGKVTDLRELRGQWVLVHFWAAWCPPCRRELPSLARLFRERGAELPRLVMVNTADTENEVFAFLGKVAPDQPTLLDRDGQVTERWKPRGLPASYFVDPEGRVRFVALGGRPWEEGAYRDFLLSLKARKTP